MFFPDYSLDLYYDRILLHVKLNTSKSIIHLDYIQLKKTAKSHLEIKIFKQI